MNKNSLWNIANKRELSYLKLDKNIDIDVLIIGGGITGITTALQLVEAGKKIAIVDAHKISEGTTGFSTGNLYIPIQNFLQTIYGKFGKEATKLLINSRKEAIDFIENVIQSKSIDCNFLRRPLYIFTTEKQKIKIVEKELNILKEFGIAAENTNELPIAIKSKKAIKIEHQARFNPFQYINELAAYLASRGCQIFEHTTVTDIGEEKDHCIVHANDRIIKAKNVVIATHLPIGINKTHFLAYAYRSYAIAAKLNHDSYPNGNFWHIDAPFFASSTHNVYSDELDTLIVSGCHHKTGQANSQQQYDLVENYLRNNFAIKEITQCWSAQHYRPADNVPYIGLASTDSKRTYIATGFSTDGLTYGTVAGLLLSDLILNKTNPWAKLYRTNRFKPFASLSQFSKENLNVMCQYLKDYPENVEGKNYKDVKPEEGKIIAIDKQKYAVYCDKNGAMHIVSAVCTHMKCIVKWNNAEKSWDCPCHGSRFTVDGNVIEGPAVKPLQKYEAE